MCGKNYPNRETFDTTIAKTVHISLHTRCVFRYVKFISRAAATD